MRNTRSKKKLDQNNGGSSGSKERGNSRTSPSLWFCFTMFNYSLDDISWFRGSTVLSKYVFQEELCPKTNRKHLQGTVKYKKKVRLTTVNKDFPGCHWECTRCIKASEKYCWKTETKLEGGGQWFEGIHIPRPWMF